MTPVPDFVPSDAFAFLDPDSPRFEVFFPTIEANYRGGSMSKEQARQAAYRQFRVSVRQVFPKSGGRARKVTLDDLFHLVLIRFAEKGLAERFDPQAGNSVESFIRGVAQNVLKEISRKKLRETQSTDGEVVDERAIDPHDGASVRDESWLVERMTWLLPEGQRLAIWRKYGNGMPDVEGTIGSEATRRHRGIRKLRRLLVVHKAFD